MTKPIQLTRGLVAIVDDEDYERVALRSWIAVPEGDNWYARTRGRRSEGEKQNLYMQNFIMGAIGIDHVNRNGLDNRKCNLRPATKLQQAWNRTKRKNCTSKYKGVYLFRQGTYKAWRAMIRIDKKLKDLGLHHCETAAALAYDRAAKETFGEFAVLNILRP